MVSWSADFVPAPCAEFPNDNPALHEGAVWTCLHEGGALRPVVRPKVLAAAPPPPSRQEPPAVAAAMESVAPPLTARGPVLVPPRPSRSPAPSELRAKPPSERPVRPRRVFASPPRVIALEPSCPLPEEVAEVVAQWLAPPVSRRAAPGPTLELIVFEPSPVPPSVLVSPAPPDDVVLESFELPPVPELPSEPDVAGRSAAPSEPPPERPVVVESEPPLEADEPDAYGAFVGALVAVALATGSTRAAAVLPGFLTEGRIPGASVDDGMAAGLADAGLALQEGGQVVSTPALRTVATAWRGVLTGESEDFSSCGTSTLDQWAAELLVAFGVQSGDLRRDLRRHGVAAFGMLVAA